MNCQQCGLPDPYRGQGDGIGSCECPRCDCCGAAPDECDCDRDYDEYHAFDDDDPDAEFDDFLCNDLACPRRRARAATKRTEVSTP